MSKITRTTMSKTRRLSARKVMNADEFTMTYRATSTAIGTVLTPDASGSVKMVRGTFSANKAGIDAPIGASFSLTRSGDDIILDRVFFMPKSMFDTLTAKGASAHEIADAAEKFEADSGITTA